MDQIKIDRINVLAKKSKNEGLTLSEKVEQKKLREEYIESFRRSMRGQLDSIVYVDEQGNKIPLQRKKKVTAMHIHDEHHNN